MKAKRPRLLISVRNEVEAIDALFGGADVIDVKEPSRGALGAADIDTVKKIVAAVAGRRPVSIALGELKENWSGRLPGGIEYAKIGLAGAAQSWQDRLAACFDAITPVKPIVVAYADYKRVAAPPVEQVLDWAIEYGATGVLIDTAIKKGGGLFDWLSEGKLLRLIARAHEAGLIAALAGSLRGQQLVNVIEMGADIIAVRGAACAWGDRQGQINPQRVRDLANLVEAHTLSSAVPAR